MMTMSNRAVALAVCGWLSGCPPVNPETADAGLVKGEAVSKSIDQGGGSLVHSKGGVISVPAGALLAPTELSITYVESGYPALDSSYTPSSVVMALEPHGQTFASPVWIMVPHTAGSGDQPLALLTAPVDGAWSKVQGATFDDHSAHAALSHFSFVAVVLASGCGDDQQPCCSDRSQCSGDCVDDGCVGDLACLFKQDGSNYCALCGEVFQPCCGADDGEGGTCNDYTRLSCVPDATSHTGTCLPVCGSDRRVCCAGATCEQYPPDHYIQLRCVDNLCEECYQHGVCTVDPTDCCADAQYFEYCCGGIGCCI